MTPQEFRTLEKGDHVHPPDRPDDIWTVVAFQSQYRSWLAVQGNIIMNRRSGKFWTCAGILSDNDLEEAMECLGLKAIRQIPANWEKKIEFDIVP